jgi:hypothetical protein
MHVCMYVCVCLSVCVSTGTSLIAGTNSGRCFIWSLKVSQDAPPCKQKQQFLNPKPCLKPNLIKSLSRRASLYA